MDCAPCLCLPCNRTPNLSAVFLEETDDTEGPNCSAAWGKKTWIGEEEPGGEWVERRGCPSGEWDHGCMIWNRFLKEAEPPACYFSSLSDTLTCSIERVREFGICNCLPCASLFSAPKSTFPRQNSVLSCETN